MVGRARWKAGGVDALEAVLSRLPASEELVRRRFWRDPEFRSVCEDYRDAQEVLARLERSQPPDLVLTEEYRQLTAELLTEAIDLLKGEQP